MSQFEDHFPADRKCRLYYRGWLPDDKPRAVLVIVHGLAEHSGRYANLAAHFVPRGYALYAHDQRGHGQSPGKHGYVKRFADFTGDLNAFLGLIRRRHPGTPVFLVGHSVGGLIATVYTARNPEGLAGLILSGATLKTGNSVPPAAVILARLLSWLLPGLGLAVIDASAISQDQAVVTAYVNDPLVYRGKISARLGAELVTGLKRLPRLIPGIKLPLLIMHGTADRLSDPAGSQLLYDRAGSPDKTLRVYPGFYHEIFNEPGRERVLTDMATWLSERL
ncbi:MAG: alpha/beta hydrolase [Chloroflexota bacterium]